MNLKQLKKLKEIIVEIEATTERYEGRFGETLSATLVLAAPFTLFLNIVYFESPLHTGIAS